MNEINMYSHTDEMLCKAQKILRESCDTHISIDWGCDGYSFSIIKGDSTKSIRPNKGNFQKLKS